MNTNATLIQWNFSHSCFEVLGHFDQSPKPEPEPVVITAAAAKPFVYRQALQRDSLTGQLV